jgi:hypothetical protein
VEGERDLVDGRHVDALDHGPELDVAEQGDLALHVVGERVLGAADEEVRLDADLHELAHRVLRRLGLHLAGRRDVGHEREVDERRVRLPHLVAELTDGLEEGERLDVAHGAAHLDDHHVVARRDALDRRLDLVGDVRDDLHRAAQVLAAPFLGDDVQVDPPRGDVVRLRQRPVEEALVVPQVEVRSPRRRRSRTPRRAGTATWCPDRRSGTDRT